MKMVIFQDMKGYLIQKQEFDEKLKENVSLLEDKFLLTLELGGDSIKKITYLEDKPKIIEDGIFKLKDEKSLFITMEKLKEIFNISSKDPLLLDIKRKVGHDKFEDVFDTRNITEHDKIFYLFYETKKDYTTINIIGDTDE